MDTKLPFNEEAHQRLRCPRHHTVLHFSTNGLHLWCRHCKIEVRLSWEEILQMRENVKKINKKEL